MSEQASRKFKKELNAGAISLVLLAVLERFNVPMYGYEIAKRLVADADDELPMNQGAIYPVLRSLEKQGLLESTTRASNAGPPRKYYSLTAAGRTVLAEWTGVWRRTKLFVDSNLEQSHDSARLPGASPTAGRTISKPVGIRSQTKNRSRS